MAPNVEMGEMDDVEEFVRVEEDRGASFVARKSLAEYGHGAAQVVHEHVECQTISGDWHLKGEGAQPEDKMRHDSGWEFHIQYHT
jgi:hypothetical protein